MSTLKRTTTKGEFKRRLRPSEVRRLLIARRLQRAKLQFERTKNPLFVWQAYETARSARSDKIPEWVLAYFDSCCSDLMILATFGKVKVLRHFKEQQLEKAGTAAIIANVLGMKREGRDGRGDVFSRYMVDLRSLDLADRVAEYRLDGNQETDAFYLVHKDRNVSTSTVRRAWLKWQSLKYPEFSEVAD